MPADASPSQNASANAGFDSPPDTAPPSMPDVPREPAAARDDYSPPAERSEPVETDFVRSAPSEAWSPPEQSFAEPPREEDRGDRGGSEPASDGGGESAPPSENERQAG
jgi:hypothetical protein